MNIAIKDIKTPRSAGSSTLIAPVISITSKKITIHDLAAQLDISATTVWRAINDKPRISSKTRQRVLKAAKSLNYRPSMVAQTLRKQKTDTIGVIVPMIGNTTYSLIVRAIEQMAFEKGYNILLCDTDLDIQREKDYADLLIRRRVEGGIIVPLARRKPGEFEHLLELEFNNIPVVIAEQEIPDLALTQVTVDNCTGAKRLTKHLADLGHERIAFLHAGLPEWDFVQSRRFTGYKLALEDVGLKYDPALVFKAAEMTVVDAGNLKKDALANLFKEPNPPTAIFAYCDGLAIKIMRLLQELGLKVPDDIAVVGFDDINFSSQLSTSLTTFKQPSKELGRRAVEILFSRLESGSVSVQKPVYEKLKGELIIRESCSVKKIVRK